MEPAHLVGTGGAVGAVCRHYIGTWLHHDRLPVGTLGVNVIGSFVLSVVVFTGFPEETALLVGTGACGSFTTYSSFSVQTLRLWETGERLRGVIYAGGTMALCLVAAALGAGIVSLLS